MGNTNNTPGNPSEVPPEYTTPYTNYTLSTNIRSYATQNYINLTSLIHDMLLFNGNTRINYCSYLFIKSMEKDYLSSINNPRNFTTNNIFSSDIIKFMVKNQKYYTVSATCYDDVALLNKYYTNPVESFGVIDFIGNTELDCCSQFQTQLGTEYICNGGAIEKNERNGHLLVRNGLLAFLSKIERPRLEIPFNEISDFDNINLQSQYKINIKSFSYISDQKKVDNSEVYYSTTEQVEIIKSIKVAIMCYGTLGVEFIARKNIRADNGEEIEIEYLVNACIIGWLKIDEILAWQIRIPKEDGYSDFIRMASIHSHISEMSGIDIPVPNKRVAGRKINGPYIIRLGLCFPTCDTSCGQPNGCESVCGNITLYNNQTNWVLSYGASGGFNKFLVTLDINPTTGGSLLYNNVQQLFLRYPLIKNIYGNDIYIQGIFTTVGPRLGGNLNFNRETNTYSYSLDNTITLTACQCVKDPLCK